MNAHRARWAGVGALFFLAALALDVGAGYGVDDFWFLQVAERVLAGEVLYRDVYLNVPPLSLYLTAPLVAVTGGQLIAVKIICSALFATSCWLSLRVGARVGGLRRGELVLIGAALVALGTAPAGTPYAPLALAALVGALAAVVDWLEGGDRSRLALTGALAGVAFVSKHTIGIAVLAAVAASIALGARSARPPLRYWTPSALYAFAAFAAVLVLALLPVLASGALPDLVEAATGKRALLERAQISYFQGIQDQFTQLAQRGPLDGAESLARMLAFLLPPAAMLALFAALLWSRPKARVTLWVVGLFWAAAMVNLVPRADLPHMAPAAPASILLVACSFGALRGRIPSRVPRAVAAAATAGCLLALVANPLHELVSGDSEVSRVAALSGVLVDEELQRDLQSRVDRLAAATRSRGPTFLLLPDAAMYYRLTGLSNPTRYDYPLASALGEGGEDAVIRAIRRGAIHQVCMAALAGSKLNASRLFAYVRATMIPAGDAGCRMYRSSG